MELTRFLDWIMVLPERLEQRFDEEMLQIEEDRKMKYVTSHERLATERGMQQGLQQGLQQGSLKQSREDIVDILRARFKRIPRTLVRNVNALDDLSLLRELLKNAATVQSLQRFQEILDAGSLVEEVTLV